MVSRSVAVMLLVVGLIIGAGVTFVAFPKQTTANTSTAPQQTTTTTITAPASTATTTSVLTLMLVPEMHTEFETISNLVTGVETSTYTFTRTSLTVTSSPLATILTAYLFVNSSTGADGLYIQAGTLNVSISSNKTVNFEMMNSALFTQYQMGKSVPMCSSTSCNLDQDGAKVGIASGSFYFQITTPGTYYYWVDNDYGGSGSAAISGSMGMVVQQTSTYEVTSTSLYTTTTMNQTTATMTDTSYSTSTVG